MPDRIDPMNHPITIHFRHVERGVVSVPPDDVEVPYYVDSIEYRPAVLRVKPGDSIHWISNFNLKVSFHRGTPLRCSQVVATKSPGGDPDLDNAISVSELVVTEEKKGYHYNVHGALVIHGELVIIGDPGCPEIIVE